MSHVISKGRVSIRALTLCLVILSAPMLAGSCEEGTTTLAWACVGESWAALTCPQIAANTSYPVYNLAVPGSTIAGQAVGIQAVKDGLAAIPEDVVFIWLSMGTLYPDSFELQLGQAAYDLYRPDVVAGLAIRSYIREIREVRPESVVIIARHQSPWTDAALDWVLPVEGAIMIDFSCFDSVVQYVDGLHIRPEDYLLRYQYVSNQVECPTP